MIGLGRDSLFKRLKNPLRAHAGGGFFLMCGFFGGRGFPASHATLQERWYDPWPQSAGRICGSPT